MEVQLIDQTLVNLGFNFFSFVFDLFLFFDLLLNGLAVLLQVL